MEEYIKLSDPGARAGFGYMASVAWPLWPGLFPLSYWTLSSLVGTVTVVSPLELVRTKLQAQHVSYRELAACVQAAVSQGGWRSLWLGWGPTALRDIPFSGRHAGSGPRGRSSW